jgi:hypothetical protein
MKRWSAAGVPLMASVLWGLAIVNNALPRRKLLGTFTR